MSYAAAGDRAKLVDADSGVFTYAYDALNRASYVQDPDANFTTFQYDAASQRTTLADASGATRAYQHDLVGRLVGQIDYTAGLASQIVSFTDTYDAVGNRTGRTLVESGTTTVTTWTYDAAYRLLGQAAPNVNATFAYDPAGNVLLKQQDGSAAITFAYDAANRLLTGVQGSAVTTYAYDPTGNLISEQALGNVWTTYAYDNENRLTQVVYLGNTRSTYVYRGDGLRYSAVEPTYTGPNTFIWDGTDYLMEKM